MPFALQNRALFEGEKRAKRCGEKGRKRGDLGIYDGNPKERSGQGSTWKSQLQIADRKRATSTVSFSETGESLANEGPRKAFESPKMPLFPLSFSTLERGAKVC